MKKKILVTAVAGLLAGMSATASAQGPRGDAKGINVSLENSLFDTTEQVMMWKGKFFTAPDVAIIGGFGFNTYGSDAEGTDLSFQIGGRKYMGTGSFAPFFGGSFAYESLESVAGTIPGLDKVTTVAIVGEFGGEYFFSPQFSIEGALRAGFSSEDQDFVGGGSFTTTRLGTFGSQISANFYF